MREFVESSVLNNILEIHTNAHRHLANTVYMSHVETFSAFQCPGLIGAVEMRLAIISYRVTISVNKYCRVVIFGICRPS